MMRAAALLLLLALCAGAAHAAEDAQLFALYARGDYEQAMRAGAAAHTPYGYALAARAALAEAALRPSPCLPCLERAEGLARQAVAADPGLADGQVWLAAALGYESRISGLVSARLHRRPEQAKAALDAAIAAEPRHAYALAALGGWNVEVVKAAGPMLARMLYGATLPAGLALFDRAAQAAPGNVAVRYQIALSLAGLDPRVHRTRIAAELDAALRAKAQTSYERAMQGRAADLKAALADDRVRFDALVRKLQGYP